ncbi:MAG: hypothetical protein FWC89_00260 [Defluviitaleaceae bacterium]|nr:hypothetical protein [Defluviitaleaceae bacterium]
MQALVKYNISYYLNSAKYLPPVICFAVFLGVNYSSAPIGIWSNLYITAVALFIFANWVSASFVNCEHKTQQFITRLHVNNDTRYHLSKIISLVMFLIPFQVITILIPIVTGMFIRGILFREVVIYVIMHLLFSLMGLAIGIFFNADLFSKELATFAHLFIIMVIVIPFNVIFADNALISFAYRLLPPINLLAERLHYIDNGAFPVDVLFLIFVVNAAVYAFGLIVLYVFIMRRKQG